MQCMEAAGGQNVSLPTVTATASVVNTLLDAGQLDEEDFLSNLAGGLRIPSVAMPLPDAEEAPELKRLLPARVALKRRLLPLQLIPEEGTERKKIALATCDPFDLLARASGRPRGGRARCAGASRPASACSRHCAISTALVPMCSMEILKGRECRCRRARPARRGQRH